MTSSWFTLAQTSQEAFRTTEFDLPQSSIGMLALLAGFALLFALVIITSLRDSRSLSLPWRISLLALRLLAVSLILMIVVNPQSRTQITQVQPSRVGILVDTSLSMAYPSADSADNNVAEKDIVSRAEAAQEAFLESGLLKTLSKTHAVSVFTFDEALTGPQAITVGDSTTFVDQNADAAEGPSDSTDNSNNDTARIDLTEGDDSADPTAQWNEIFQPRGGETRLGESLHQLVGDLTGRTLSGIVVLTDGRSNAGLDTEVAAARATRTDTNVITVGLGSRTPQVNLWMAGMQSPSDVHRGDPFDINVVLQGLSLPGEVGRVKLYQQSVGSDGSDRKEVGDQPFELPEENPPAEVRFQQTLTVPGKYEFIAIAELADGTFQELTLDDNQRRREIEVTDRKQKVLIISSGPMRDYQFVRNSLFRHSGIDSDVWLQTVTKENLGFVSQEAAKLLTEFPRTEAGLFEYDVIVAFDADWSKLNAEQQLFLNRWVDEHSGGIVFVAGEIFTPELARSPDKFTDVLSLYPVVLNRMLAELKVTQRADTSWPIVLTSEGRSSEFLKIADATGRADTDLWKKFRGIYRSYPVKSVKDGATVLGSYGNPRASTKDGLPPWLAMQYFGKGRTMFIGSAETWRLRAISPEGHQRFWTSLIREVGQGRRKRGRSRGLLLLDKTETSPGQTVTIRAQVYDARMQPLQRESLAISIINDQGQPVNVPTELRPDGRRPGQFVNVFRPSKPGVYRVTVPVPESSDVLQANIEVVLPNLESADPSQHVRLLTKFTEQSAGDYLTLAEAIDRLPDMLPDRSEPILIDEKLQTLWDRAWIMFLIVGLLAAEWALRRVVRLS